MKIHAEEVFKRHTQFILFIGIALLSITSIIINLKSVSSYKRPLIIAVDTNGARIVSQLTDPIYKTEALSFIQKFLFNVYNFNSQNFIKRIGFATSIMSEDLWKKKENEILDLKNKVERDQIEITSEIQKITLDENSTYHALISVYEKSRLNETNHLVKISLKLKQTTRSNENPSGLEVDSYEETIIRH